MFILSDEFAKLILFDKIDRTTAPKAPAQSTTMTRHDDTQRWPLPDGWRWMQLGELAHIEMGQSPPGEATNSAGKGYPLLGGASDMGVIYPTPSRHTSEPTKLCEVGDIILCIRATIGRTNFADSVYCLGRGVAGLRSKAIDHKFLSYYLKLQEEALNDLGTGTTFKQINKDTLKSFAIPVPPLDTQRQLVTTIERLFARVARAREALSAAPDLLEQLRQSVLAAAFRGDLTRAWREANPDAEPADALLDRIRDARRARFIDDYAAKKLDKLRAKSPISPADEPTLLAAARREAEKKYTPPAPLSPDDLTDLPELPQGWRWSAAEELSWELTVGYVGKMEDQYISEGVPFLRSQNIRANRFDPQNMKYISQKFHDQISKSKLSPGDLAIVRSGAPGTACVIPEQLEDANCSDLVIVRLIDKINPYFMSFFMNSTTAMRQVFDMQVGVAQQHFNVGAMKKLFAPLTSEAEQAKIVATLQGWDSTINQLVTQVADMTTQLDQLEQSILSKAFRGELGGIEAAVERVEAVASAATQGSLFDL